MRKFSALLLLAIAVASCNNSPDTTAANTDTTSNNTIVMDNSVLTAEEKADGWIALFDGKTFAGWHKYGGGPVGSAWKITDGAIWMDTATKSNGKVTGGGDLVTDEEFANFHLRLEWKIAKNGNSGIMYYVNEDTMKFKKPYETGPEMQVLDNDGHADGRITRHRAGDLYDLVSCSKETVRPVGEWNLAEIKCVNGKLDFFLNGENVVSTTMWDENWNKMVANSKFKEWKDFGTFKSGRICLQDHDNTVWFRNIRIKKY